MKKKIVFAIGLVLLLMYGYVQGFPFHGAVSTPTNTVSETNVAPQAILKLTYSGEKGKNALVLLKEKASFEQDSSGLVTSINKRKADVSKREYWAFYVNGKLAPVGPADYVTKDDDKIEWKLETY